MTVLQRPRRGARRASLTAALAGAMASVALLAGCGDDDSDQAAGPTQTSTTEVVVQTASEGFNAARIYDQAAPGVVTVVSIFDGEGSALDARGGQGSGFVVSDEGEIVTNAHVVTSGGRNNGGGEPREADQVFVEFADRNRVGAEIVGFDPDADLALIRVDTKDLDLRPLAISDRNGVAVGEPVAAIGSPFGEQQSLSIGVVSATDRTVESLTQFAIDDAVQTDASINPGNSGGPLLDADGKVIGVNQQIASASGSNAGVGFAIPASALRFSLSQLREDGEVEYAFIGVSTQTVWPQLADELGLESEGGALITEVVEGSPADDAGLRGASDRITFQGSRVETGGDLIVSVDGEGLTGTRELPEAIATRRPGEAITLEIIRDGERDEVEVDLESRPESPIRE